MAEKKTAPERALRKAGLSYERKHHYNWNKCTLTAYAGRFPDFCKLIDEDAEQGYKEFIIRKGRFCFRLTAPYSEERREKARQLAMESNASDRLK